MKSISMTSAKVLAVRGLSTVALAISAVAVIFASSAHAQINNKVAQETGSWDEIDWYLDGVPPAVGSPVSGDAAIIGNDLSVDYDSGISTTVSRLYVGDNTGSPSGTGSLTISDGTITAAAGGISILVVGRSADSVGTLDVTGGTLSGTSTGSSGTGLQVGAGANSEGTVNLSAGAITLSGGVQLGVGAGSSGTMTVSGTGSLSTGSASGSQIFYVGGRANDSTTTGHFEQTNGTVAINSGDFMGIGFSGAASQDTIGTVLLTGGSFTGNVRVGRASASGGGGSGTLTIGPLANVSGSTQAWDISGTGEIVFELGSSFSFNAVNLTAATAASALLFSEAGAKITIDGSALDFSLGGGPIDLFTFAMGKAPTELSKSNVIFGYTGFAEGYTPQLVWTDTSLQLNLYAVPEPSTAALLVLAAVGGMVARRRQRC